MPPKKTVNLTVPSDLLDQFESVCRHYGHAKQKGMVLSAAILMFLEADPADQGECLKQIAVCDIEEGVAELKDKAGKEQSLRAALRKAEQRAAGDPAGPTRPRKAAKPARTSKRRVTKLPSIDQIRKDRGKG